MALDHEVGQLTHAPVSQAIVKVLRMQIEGRNAQEHVGALAEDFFLSPMNQLCSDATAAPIWMHANQLDVTLERSIEIKDEDTDDLSADRGDVNLARRIGQPLHGHVKSEAKRNPRFRRNQKIGTELGFAVIEKRADCRIGNAG